MYFKSIGMQYKHKLMPYNSSFYIWNNKKKWINSFYAGMFKFCAKNVWNRIRHLKNLLRDTTEALRSFLSEPTKFSNLLSSGSLVLVRRGCLNNSPLFSIQIVFFFQIVWNNSFSQQWYFEQWTSNLVTPFVQSKKLLE